MVTAAPANPSLADVYKAYGEAAHVAQDFEVCIKCLRMLIGIGEDANTQIDWTTEELLARAPACSTDLPDVPPTNWRKLHKLLKTGTIGSVKREVEMRMHRRSLDGESSFIEFEAARIARNSLAHNFFVTHGEALNTAAGRLQVIFLLDVIRRLCAEAAQLAAAISDALSDHLPKSFDRFRKLVAEMRKGENKRAEAQAPCPAGLPSRSMLRQSTHLNRSWHNGRS